MIKQEFNIFKEIGSNWLIGSICLYSNGYCIKNFYAQRKKYAVFMQN